MDKIFLEYYGSALGINIIAALEEQFEIATDETHSPVKKQKQDNCGHPILPSSLLAEIWKNKDMKVVAGYGQHDAQEFFEAFVNCLGTNNLAYQKSAQDMRQILPGNQISRINPSTCSGDNHGTDFIRKMLTGTLRSVLSCHKCGCKRGQTESFLNISLPLAKKFPTANSEGKNSQRQGKVSLKVCLNHFTRPSFLAKVVHCPSCNSKTRTLRQCTFSRLPHIFCLHLNRFDASANKKITDFVEFPASNLDMGKYLPDWCERGHEMNKTSKELNARSPKLLYDLFGVVNHKGSSQQGHYVANVKCGNRWFSCDDALVTPAGEGDGEKEVLLSEGAYMLFYQKK